MIELAAGVNIQQGSIRYGSVEIDPDGASVFLGACNYRAVVRGQTVIVDYGIDGPRNLEVVRLLFAFPGAAEAVARVINAQSAALMRRDEESDRAILATVGERDGDPQF